MISVPDVKPSIFQVAAEAHFWVILAVSSDQFGCSLLDNFCRNRFLSHAYVSKHFVDPSKMHVELWEGHGEHDVPLRAINSWKCCYFKVPLIPKTNYCLLAKNLIFQNLKERKNNNHFLKQILYLKANKLTKSKYDFITSKKPRINYFIGTN